MLISVLALVAVLVMSLLALNVYKHEGRSFRKSGIYDRASRLQGNDAGIGVETQLALTNSAAHDQVSSTREGGLVGIVSSTQEPGVTIKSKIKLGREPEHDRTKHALLTSPNPPHPSKEEAGGGAGPEEIVKVHCTSTKGPFQIDVHPSWSPIGADRFLDMVRSGFFTEVAMLRVLAGFLVQFGLNSDPAIQRQWDNKGRLKDDPNIHIPFRKGVLSFAGSGPNSRDTSMFITYAEKGGGLGESPWETPFGIVVEGMDSVDLFYEGYGELRGIGSGKGPDWNRARTEGGAYLQREFPKMDYIRSCEIVEDSIEMGHRDESVGTTIIGDASRSTDNHTHVHCSTSKGDLEIVARPDWSPHGAERFVRLVQAGFFTNMLFYRVPPLESNPIAQFGLAWESATRKEVSGMGSIPDDHPRQLISQEKGHFGFGGGGPDSRTCHMWIARKTFAEVSPMLGKSSWDTSVAQIVSGLSVLDELEQVGDMAPWGDGPETGKIENDPAFETSFPGTYIKQHYPKIDYFNWCRIVEHSL